MKPSTFQEAIYTWVTAGTGHGIVEAVAGSGKTTTLVEVGKLIPRTAKALFCAFNKHIEQTLRSRLPVTVDVSTLHALGFRAVRKIVSKCRVDGGKYGPIIDDRSKDVAYAVFGQAQAEELRTVRAVLKDMVQFCRVHLADPRDPAALAECAERFGVEIDPRDLRHYGPAITAILEEGKRQALRGTIDFTDMLWIPIVCGVIADRYDFVMVDECQDLNRAQLELVLRSLTETGRLLAVGDPRQAIYGFAGADSESFAEIERRTKATRLPLHVSYRCPQEVVKLASAFAPILPWEQAAAGTVADVTYASIFESAQEGDLILSRTNALGIKTVLGFLARRVPCKMRGRDVGAKILAAMDAVHKAARKVWVEFPNALDDVTFKQTDKLSRQKGKEAQIQTVEDIAAAISACLEAFTEATDYDSFRAMVADLFSDEGNPIWVSTIHRAKGLENGTVFILDFDRLPMKFKNQTPSQAAQESNLLYVAITRSMSTLNLVESDPTARKAKK